MFNPRQVLDEQLTGYCVRESAAFSTLMRMDFKNLSPFEMTRTYH